MSTTTGQCLCGSPQYRVTGPLGEVRYCHCHMCRRATGPVFARLARDPGHVRIRLGGLERPEAVEITGHVWTESKADWYAIHDRLPKYPQGFGSGDHELDVGEIDGTR